MESFVQGLRLLASSSSLLLPSNLAYRELVVEACYALSNLALPSALVHSKGLEDVEQTIARFISSFQVLTEMACGSFAGRRLQSQMIVCLETCKSMCRLSALLRCSRHSMLLKWELSPLDLASYAQHHSQPQHASSRIPQHMHQHAPPSPSSQTQTGRRSGLQLTFRGGLAAALDQQQQQQQQPLPVDPCMLIRDQADTEELVEDDVQPVQPQAQALSPERLLLMAELLYALRPMVYVILLHLSDGEAPAPDTLLHRLRGALAFLVSLALDLASIQLSSQALLAARGGAPDEIQRPHPFDEELARRRMLLYLYLLRSPLFDRATLPAMLRMAQLLKGVPLGGTMAQYGVDMLRFVHSVHFYHSNS